MSRWLLLITSASLVLNACAFEDISDIEAYIADVKQRQPGPIEPLPELKGPFLAPRELGTDPFAPLSRN